MSFTAGFKAGVGHGEKSWRQMGSIPFELEEEEHICRLTEQDI